MASSRGNPPGALRNLFADLPARGDGEAFEDLLRAPGLRIERIVSRGHRSPAQGWYDQDAHEWVLVLAGRGVLEFDDGRRLTLLPGDAVDIPAHVRHRVAETDPDQPTIWLAVFHGPGVDPP